VAFFMKQAGARPYTMEQDPTYACEHEEERTLRLLDRKGGDLAELPEDLRVRQFPRAAVRACRVCRCTDADCSGCIARTGEPCHWVEADLCSACV
jgi:hypothetical protein